MKAEKYKVNINQVWSEEVIVSANNKREAKKKAWEKWKAKKINYSFDAIKNK